MNRFLEFLGRRVANYLNRPTGNYRQFDVSLHDDLKKVLRPADVLLVEGDLRISTAIKYLTQSTWSHACLFIGDALDGDDPTPNPNIEPLSLIEADLIHGVAAVPLNTHIHLNLRICRPFGLSDADRKRVVQFAIDHIGHDYDLRNVFDLARYLLPTPLIPTRFRRSLIEMGSGDPTRAICSTLIAQAFQSVRYPILPRRCSPREIDGDDGAQDHSDQQLLSLRHYSHFTPRDFDLSPFFATIKPTQERGFDYKSLRWDDL